MNLFTSELFSGAMLQHDRPRPSRGYREPLFAMRYGRRRADRAEPSALQLLPALIVRIRAPRSPHDYGRAA
jgi:hypothetical protein